ncbi:MAG: HNH endonuclease [Eubacterium sp.]|nr:HNH endonuclease [Eubacterium sp.]
MDLSELKQDLEDSYQVGFNIKGVPTDFTVTLVGSSKDKFKIVGKVKDNIRLNIVAEPERYGANFLRLINYSDRVKRTNFISLMKEITNGDTKLMINNVKLDESQFLEDSTDWNKFEIKYTKIPYSDEGLLKRTVNLICGMMLSLIDYSIEGAEEGKQYNVRVNKYERNPINRKICLDNKGYKCCICGFDFEKIYGEIGKNTIEVHHTTPVSQMGDGYIVKPLEDLVPVCSNCHTIIHKRKEPYTIEEVKSMLEKAKGEQL